MNNDIADSANQRKCSLCGRTFKWFSEKPGINVFDLPIGHCPRCRQAFCPDYSSTNNAKIYPVAGATRIDMKTLMRNQIHEALKHKWLKGIEIGCDPVYYMATKAANEMISCKK